MSSLISTLDSDRFGFQVAKCSVEELRGVGGVGDLEEQSVSLCVARCDMNDVEGLNWLEEQGFQIKDVQVRYEIRLSDEVKIDAKIVDSSELLFKSVSEEDVEQVMCLAAEGFQGYGHYSNDRRLDQGKCHEIYVDWARRSMLEPSVATTVIGAFKDGALIGFLSLLEESSKEEDSEGLEASGVMGVVGKRFQGAGVFQQLIRASINWGRERTHLRHSHNVLVNNIPVNRAFQRMNFVSSTSFATFHWWNAE